MRRCAGRRVQPTGMVNGGALTDLQFHQHLVTTNAQRDELVDAPSMALPIATILGSSTSSTAVGLTFAQSALDHPVSMTLRTRQVGGIPPPPPPGQGCDSIPQPCPSHKGRTYCKNVLKPGQCDSPPSPCPPCPRPPPPPHTHTAIHQQSRATITPIVAASRTWPRQLPLAAHSPSVGSTRGSEVVQLQLCSASQCCCMKTASGQRCAGMTPHILK